MGCLVGDEGVEERGRGDGFVIGVLGGVWFAVGAGGKGFAPSRSERGGDLIFGGS